MKFLKPLLLVCLIASITPLFSTTYYLDFSQGSNANDGLSPETAWKDLFKIRAAFPAPADTFLFKRGESWEGLQMYIDASGTADQPIVYGAYGDPVEPLPIISTVAALPDASVGANWTETEPNIWTLSLTRTPGRLFLDEGEYLRAHTLADLATTDNEGAFAHWFYEAGSQLLYLYAEQNPASAYGQIEGSLQFNTVLAFAADYLVFDQLDVRGGGGAALSINGGSHIRVTNCALGKWANSGLTLIDQAVAGVRQNTSFVSVSGNSFDSDFTFFYGLGSERGCGDGIKLFYGVDNCVVSNNSFRNWAHNAIELLATQSGGAGVTGNQFYDNYLTAPDIPYAHPFGVDGLLDKCRDNEFYRNFIENCRTASQVNGNNNWVHHNIIRGMRNSPSKPNEPTAHAFILGIYGNGFVSQDNRFDHNLIIDTDESAFLIRGYGLPGQVQNHAIRNNICYETGQQPRGEAYAQGTQLVIYDTQTDGVGGNAFQHNLFYSNLGSDQVVYIQDDGSYYTAEGFNALNGVDGNVIEENISGDPLFTDFANGNYLPTLASPVIDAGLDVGIAFDYALAPRVFGPAPDIGPFEIQESGTWSPVKLKVLRRGRVELRWRNNSARFSRRYVIERKAGERPWRRIGRVDARLRSPDPVPYVFVDRTPPPGQVHYRILRKDKDGTSQYSEAVSVRLRPRNSLSLARIDTETLQVLSTEEWDWSQTTIQVFRHDSRLMGLVKGSPTVSLGDLPAGIYYLHIHWSDQVEIKRFIR